MSGQAVNLLHVGSNPTLRAMKKIRQWLKNKTSYFELWIFGPLMVAHKIGNFKTLNDAERLKDMLTRTSIGYITIVRKSWLLR